MLMPKIILICMATLIAIAGAFYLLVRPGRGDVIESWQTGNSVFNVRVTAYNETNIFPAPSGAYYVFQSARLNSDIWRDIMTFRHDDPVKIARDHIRFVNDQVGYLFMGWLYAVTKDGGETWIIWDGNKDLRLTLKDWRCSYNFIKDVKLESNGSGKMVVKPLTDYADIEDLYLHTDDYGAHWIPQKYNLTQNPQ
jgi:hypothetical protein